MNSLQKPSGETPARSRVLLTVQILLTLLTGSFALLSWWNDSVYFWRLYSGLFAGSLTALIFRSGWLIPCTVCGTLFGIFLDPTIKGGTIDSQMWETVSSLWSGVIAGVVFGFAINTTLTATENESEKETDNGRDSA
ncbi:hypothetical protein Enr10x_21870 [Gimesia panareensis]|uniref:Uncharacterized protein n=1 Tax=Gimesia panareensis TaxID=2527978 RepID=A0A517Q5H9_9PLAN|nr:hypothetical protein [Gimesia panareensis]QDT26876.1 hypothetical protein Enr10x_21870 [Gimesia panareensis]QDU50287.1 hypothetical protein Pan110_26320 [Gimesia panareensis]